MRLRRVLDARDDTLDEQRAEAWASRGYYASPDSVGDTDGMAVTAMAVQARLRDEARNRANPNKFGNRRGPHWLPSHPMYAPVLEEE